METPEHHERRQYNSEMFTTLNDISRNIGEINGTLAALAGPTGRVTKIEEAQDRAETRTWIHTAVIIPVVGSLHVLAHKLGL